VFDQVRRRAHVHIRLHELGVKKSMHVRPGEEFERVLNAVLTEVSAQRLTQPAKVVSSVTPLAAAPVTGSQRESQVAMK
jgi:hypothetical protein